MKQINHPWRRYHTSNPPTQSCQEQILGRNKWPRSWLYSLNPARRTNNRHNHTDLLGISFRSFTHSAISFESMANVIGWGTKVHHQQGQQSPDFCYTANFFIILNRWISNQSRTDKFLSIRLEGPEITSRYPAGSLAPPSHQLDCNLLVKK